MRHSLFTPGSYMCPFRTLWFLDINIFGRNNFHLEFNNLLIITYPGEIVFIWSSIVFR